MEISNNRQVLIVGAGPTGLVAAIEGARRGVPCRIIYRLPMRSQNEIEGAKRLRQSRAIAVQARTLECFEMMGIDVDAFIASGQPIRAVNIGVSTRKRIARIEFDHLPTRYPYMLLIPQRETEQGRQSREHRGSTRAQRELEHTIPELRVRASWIRSGRQRTIGAWGGRGMGVGGELSIRDIFKIADRYSRAKIKGAPSVRCRTARQRFKNWPATQILRGCCNPDTLTRWHAGITATSAMSVIVGGTGQAGEFVDFGPVYNGIIPRKAQPSARGRR